MKFLDYEKIIKDSYPILIESYVKQYGERYRKHITEAINNVDYCLFVTPKDIDAYIKTREKDNYINAVIDTLIDLELDISSVSITSDGLDIKDEHLGGLVSFLFFDENCINKGSYSFIGRIGMSTLDDEKAKKLKSVLDLLYLKYPNTSLYSYVKSSAYEKTASYFKKIHEMFQSNLERHQENDYSHEDLLAYHDELVKNNVRLLMKYKHKFFLAVKDYLPRQDQEYIESLPNLSSSVLEDFDLYFSTINSLFPDSTDMDIIFDIRNKIVDEFYRELAQSYIINDYELRKDDDVIDTIINNNGASCSITNEVLKEGTPKSIVCITPICSDYNFFDITLDHELRHAIETRAEKKGNKVFLKLGTHLAKVTLNDSHDLVEEWSEENRTYNERVTQKLSLEATKSRWENKKFILSNKYALLNTSKNSIYDYDLPNLNIIFEPFREELIQAQISPSFNVIYHVIPRKYLKIINDNISSLTLETKELFTNIATLLKINKNKKRAKQKKISFQ